MVSVPHRFAATPGKDRRRGLQWSTGRGGVRTVKFDQRMTRIHIAHAMQDRATAEGLASLLREHGIEVSLYPREINPGESFHEQVEDAIQNSDRVLVLWSKASRESSYVRREAALAAASGKLLPVSLSGASPPDEFANLNTLELGAWSGERDDPRIQTLLDALLSNVRSGRVLATQKYNSPSASRDSTLSGAPPRPQSAPSVPVGQSSSGPGMLGRAFDVVRELWPFGKREKGDGAALDTHTGAHSAGQHPPEEALEPVWLGASAPRSCTRDQRFTAALVAYVDASRASAKEKLAALGEANDRVVMDVAPQREATWRVGAPVAVRLTGEGVEVKPSEVRFDWNGRENLAAFAARVREDAPDSISLCFEVFVADVPIAFISMHLNIAVRSAPLAVQQAQESLPRSVFASYCSKDGQPVTQRLSTLQRWSPRLDIFQDCLDLRPNSAFKPKIKEEIARRDVFLLFWSRNAAASPWVEWEYKTARDTRGMDAILPMPLEDPAIAPPPPELADRHMRDRFMLAGYGLAKIRDEATRPPSP